MLSCAPYRSVIQSLYIASWNACTWTHQVPLLLHHWAYRWGKRRLCPVLVMAFFTLIKPDRTLALQVCGDLPLAAVSTDMSARCSQSRTGRCCSAALERSSLFTTASDFSLADSRSADPSPENETSSCSVCFFSCGPREIQVKVETTAESGQCCHPMH